MFKNIKAVTSSFALTLLLAAPAFAEEVAHEGGSGGLPQFDPSSWASQLFWLTIFFALLYVVFGKSIIPTLGNTIETRTSYISEHLKKAETLSAEAEILKNEINASMKSAGQVAGTDIAHAEAVAKEKLSVALTDFRKKYEQQVANTETSIESAKKSAMVDMERIIIQLATQAAEKIADIPASESGAEHVVRSLGKKVA
jgi:F-type H+-transporting ATPase subunit b